LKESPVETVDRSKIVDYFPPNMNLVSEVAPHRRLRLLMLERGWRALDLVKNAGISPSLAKKLMSGALAPSQRTAERLNGFFGEKIFGTPATGQRGKRHKRKARRKD
jgi:transcriptional regulator with XRE-family HTH domain